MVTRFSVVHELKRHWADKSVGTSRVDEKYWCVMHSGLRQIWEIGDDTEFLGSIALYAPVSRISDMAPAARAGRCDVGNHPTN